MSQSDIELRCEDDRAKVLPRLQALDEELRRTKAWGQTKRLDELVRKKEELAKAAKATQKASQKQDEGGRDAELVRRQAMKKEAEQDANAQHRRRARLNASVTPMQKLLEKQACPIFCDLRPACVD